MTITSEHIAGNWLVTIKVDNYKQNWSNKSLVRALIVAHAKLLNQMGRDRVVIITTKSDKL